jgi:hypothetical protein
MRGERKSIEKTSAMSLSNMNKASFGIKLLLEYSFNFVHLFATLASFCVMSTCLDLLECLHFQ